MTSAGCVFIQAVGCSMSCPTMTAVDMTKTGTLWDWSYVGILSAHCIAAVSPHLGSDYVILFMKWFKNHNKQIQSLTSLLIVSVALT